MGNTSGGSECSVSKPELRVFARRKRVKKTEQLQKLVELEAKPHHADKVRILFTFNLKCIKFNKILSVAVSALVEII